MDPLMKIYNEVFHFLMQVKWAKWSLEELRIRGVRKEGGEEEREGEGEEGEEGGVESDDSRTKKLVVTDDGCLCKTTLPFLLSQPARWQPSLPKRPSSFTCYSCCEQDCSIL